MYQKQEKIELLQAWKNSRTFVNEIYKFLTKDLVAKDVILFELLKKAAISILLNVSQKTSRSLQNAVGSCNEVVSLLYVARDSEFILDKDFQRIYRQLNDLVIDIENYIQEVEKATRDRYSREGRDYKESKDFKEDYSENDGEEKKHKKYEDVYKSKKYSSSENDDYKTEKKHYSDKKYFSDKKTYSDKSSSDKNQGEKKQYDKKNENNSYRNNNTYKKHTTQKD